MKCKRGTVGEDHPGDHSVLRGVTREQQCKDLGGGNSARVNSRCKGPEVEMSIS